MVKCQDELGRVKLCLRLSEANFLSEVVEELASIDEVKHKEDALRRLEGVVERHDERMLHTEEHLALLEGVVQEVPIIEILLLEHLKSEVVNLAVRPVLLYEVNFRIRPSANDFDDIEIIKVDLSTVEL